MAKGSRAAEEKNGSKSKDTKVADIKTASKTLADAEDFSMGYGDTMQHHINGGRGKSKL